MKKALVTGHMGFVGRHMFRYLTGKGWEVDGVDVVDGQSLTTFTQRVDDRYDLVVHAAARSPYRAAIDSDHGAFSYNVMLDSTMFEWATRTKQRNFVYLSSAAIYPRWMQMMRDRSTITNMPLVETDTDPIEEPFDTYGLTKLIGERMAVSMRRSGVATTIVRPFSGYGEDQSEHFPFRAFIERARRREDPLIIWGNADQVRDWIHIDDVCAGIMAVVNETTQPVNICTGVGTSMLELVNLICAEAGYAPDVIVDKTAPMGVFYRVGNPSHLHRFYQPRVTLEDGVRRALGGY